MNYLLILIPSTAVAFDGFSENGKQIRSMIEKFLFGFLCLNYLGGRE